MKKLVNIRKWWSFKTKKNAQDKVDFGKSEKRKLGTRQKQSKSSDN